MRPIGESDTEHVPVPRRNHQSPGDRRRRRCFQMLVTRAVLLSLDRGPRLRSTSGKLGKSSRTKHDGSLVVKSKMVMGQWEYDQNTVEEFEERGGVPPAVLSCSLCHPLHVPSLK